MYRLPTNFEQRLSLLQYLLLYYLLKEDMAVLYFLLKLVRKGLIKLCCNSIYCAIISKYMVHSVTKLQRYPRL